MNRSITHVLVATPLGKGGKGGIDRIVDEVRRGATPAAHPELSLRYLTTRGQGSILLAPAYLAAAIGQLILMRGWIDVLHVNLSSHGSAVRKIVLCRVAAALKIPYVVHLHGSRFRQYWDGLETKRSAQIDTMFRRAARVIVLGQVWKDFIVQRVPEAATRIEIVPNATPAPTEAPSGRIDSAVCILFLGRVGARKGVPELIDALGELAPGGWRAIIAGDGDVEEAAARIGRYGDLKDRVSLTGWVDAAGVSALLNAADIVVLPSHDENLPMSVIEGMAHGLAVVATPVGAVEDIIKHDVTGVITPVGDSGALAKNLRALLEDEPRRIRLGAAARAFHRNHLDIGPYIARLSSLWRSVATEAGR